jgi:hypothetical protein
VKALLEEAKQGKSVLLAILVSVGVTLVTLYQTYDGFFKDALGARQAWFLLLLNAFFTFLLVITLSATFKPQHKVRYALIIAFSFQALIATDLKVEPLAGATETGGATKVNLGAFYSPIEKGLTGGIDDRIGDAKGSEIATVKKMYPTSADLPRLRARLDDLLALKWGNDKSRKDLMEQVDGVLADTNTVVGTKVRDVTLFVYASAGRGTVQRLAKAE